MEFRQKYREFFDQLDSEYFDEERFVPAVGPGDADLMLIGEAPGANEVEEGEPFVGRAGEKLDEILDRIEVDRKELYITNLVKIRPPDNRDPHRDEIDAWRPLLRREIEEVEPEFIIPMGNFSSREILDTDKGITSIHGRIFSREGQKIMPTYHPAAVLYDNSKEPDLEEDLRKALGREQTGQKKLDEI
ncbi:MAG: uracil-DNA glycosylase [Candidatus Nanohaloarchaea archaeon]